MISIQTRGKSTIPGSIRIKLTILIRVGRQIKLLLQLTYIICNATAEERDFTAHHQKQKDTAGMITKTEEPLDDTGAFRDIIIGSSHSIMLLVLHGFGVKSLEELSIINSPKGTSAIAWLAR